MLFRSCNHVFSVSQIKLTGIEPQPKPINASYYDWCNYFSNLYEEDAYTKRIESSCNKCGDSFYAHCGLDLPGTLIR